ncbi:MAG: hypothetical protein ACK5B9_11725 [Flavobacteriia bacterium]|jgi:hypothetical protein
MEDILDNSENENKGGLPMFLKVLCILTFVGAGLGILGSLWSIFTFESSMKTLELQRDLFAKNPMGDMSSIVEVTRKYGMFSYLMNLLGNSLCLVGALLMWKLKKIGFFTYIPGHIFPFAGSVVMMSNMDGGTNNMMGAISSISLIIAAIFSIAFIIMYSVNYKHLK